MFLECAATYVLRCIIFRGLLDCGTLLLVPSSIANLHHLLVCFGYLYSAWLFSALFHFCALRVSGGAVGPQWDLVLSTPFSFARAAPPIRVIATSNRSIARRTLDNRNAVFSSSAVSSHAPSGSHALLPGEGRTALFLPAQRNSRSGYSGRLLKGVEKGKKRHG